MIETIIVGSGFSALTSFLLLKKYNPKVIAFSNINLKKKLLINRKNLQINKFFSNKTLSYGSLNYKLELHTKLHDRLNMGGNSNIWGGFINVSDLSKHFIKICDQYSINFNKLELKKNGYKSNNDSIRQLRDSNNNILNSTSFFKESINGYLYSFEVKKDKVLLKYLNNENNEINIIETKKLILAVSFPQLIDLLFRSGFIRNNIVLSLTEFNHKFIKSYKQTLNNYEKDSCIIKYDFLRVLKHYLGYQKSLDKFNIPLPFYIDQFFSNKTNILNLKLNLKLKQIESLDKLNNFGNSIHYCNLLIDNVNIDNFLSKISTNIIGTGMSFVKQRKPGPISNDIVNNIFDKVI